ncbi:MAG: AAA family ATPase [Thermoleophilia bacterium]
MLVGRDDELRRLDEVVAGAAAGAGGALVLRGAPGIGKTALVDAAADAARARGALVLAARPVETEAEIPFAGLADLLGPVAGRRDALPAPQAGALAGALALGPVTPGDRLAVCVATLGLLAASAEERPVVVLVDDAQWLDPPSRECLVFAGRRVAGPVALVIAVRAETDAERELAALPSIDLGPLDDVSARDLLSRVAPDLAATVADAIVGAAAGSPLALVELPGTLTDDERAGRAPLATPLRPGRRLQQVFDGHIAALPGATRLALAIAAASGSEGLRPVAAACARAGVELDALLPAEAIGIVRLGDDRVRFSHPLARGAAYHDAPADDRRRAHRALAAIETGAAAAWHPAAAAVGPDAEAAAALEAVAAEAAARRGYAVAADALERAGRLTGEPDAAAARFLGAAHAALAAGRGEQALRALAELHHCAPAGPLAVEAAHLRGIGELWGGHVGRASEQLEAVAEPLAAPAPEHAARILADAAVAATVAGACVRALALAERAHALLDEAAGPQTRAPVLAILAWSLVLRGRTDEARPILHEVERLAADVDPFSPAAQSLLLALNVRLPFEEHVRAFEESAALVEAARNAGALGVLPMLLQVVVDSGQRLGRWAGLHELASEGIALAQETGQRGPRAQLLLTRARLDAATGDEAGCREALARARTIVEPAGIGSLLTFACAVEGFLELGLGRVDEAIAALEEVERVTLEHGLEEPTLVPWAPDLVEAYVRAGRADDARRVADLLGRQAALVGTRSAGALAARTAGLVADDFDAPFAEALACHDVTPLPFERARTLLAYGSRLHRARRRVEARERLREARAILADLGAAPWLARCDAELAAAGARERPSAGNELTSQELAVARAAAGGATTREIAAALFLSPKTVEFHLGRVYRKLGVRSRAALAAAMLTRDQPPDT